MPDINETPVTVEEFMYPKNEQSISESASEGELKIYNMLANLPSVTMPTPIPNYNSTVHMTNSVTGGESKEKENILINQNHNGK